MITVALLLALQYTPETEAVMNRSRARAAEKRAAAREEAAREATPEAADEAQALPIPREIAVKLQACLDQSVNDPDGGIKFADAWRMDGGSFYARQCTGFALSRAERWTASTLAFEQAADEAERSGHAVDAARLLGQAGNAALAGGGAAKARGFFDAALARGLPNGLEKGEVYLDRARALVALGDTAKARGDLDQALVQAPADPLVWLLSATLARRTNDLPLAQKHVAQAVKLAPDDAAVALEEGNVAMLSDQEDVARAAWQRAVKLSADSAAGKAASANLAQMGAGQAGKP